MIPDHVDGKYGYAIVAAGETLKGEFSALVPDTGTATFSAKAADRHKANVSDLPNAERTGPVLGRHTEVTVDAGSAGSVRAYHESANSQTASQA